MDKNNEQMSSRRSKFKFLPPARHSNLSFIIGSFKASGAVFLDIQAQEACGMWEKDLNLYHVCCCEWRIKILSTKH